MAAQLQSIPEWGSAQLNWTLIARSLSLRNPGGAFHLMLLIAAATAALALLRRQLGAAGLLSGAAVLAFRHIRFEALFASLVVVVAGSVLTSALAALPEKIKHAKLSSIPCSVGLAIGIGFLAAALAGLRIDRSRYRPRLSCKYRSGHIRDRVIVVVPRASRCVGRA